MNGKVEDLGLKQIEKEIWFQSCFKDLSRAFNDLEVHSIRFNDSRLKRISEECFSLACEFEKKYQKYKGAYDRYHNKNKSKNNSGSSK